MSQDTPPTSVDDESLKQAVRAAWGHDAAPAALRHRIQMAVTRTLLEEPEIPQTTRSRRFWDRWPVPVRVAAGVAALLLLAIGATWGILLYQDSAPRYVSREPDHVTPAPTPTLYAVLVTQHDEFAAGAEEPHPPAADQLPATRDALGAQLRHPVWVPDLAKLGWTLDGVRVYTVNGVSDVAFHFSRGPDQISAFSLPVQSPGDSCAADPIPDVDLLVDNRSFSSFSTDGQLFALVGSRSTGPYPQSDLRALANRFRADPACRSACPTTIPSTPTP